MKAVPRAYQLAIFNSIMNRGNTLVVLPTGLGKTLIALLVIKEKIKKGRCIFLTPTKPLAKQHFETIKETLELSDKNVSLVSGEIKPEKRKELYSTDIIVSTPQTIQNDLEKGVLEARNISLVVFDEAHRSVGNYAYTYIAEKLMENDSEDGKIISPLYLALTASPGGKKERIKEVMDALKIANIEIRSATDSDVEPYVQKAKMSWVTIELTPHFKELKNELDKLTSKYAQRLGSMGFPPPIRNKGAFLQLRDKILNIQSSIKYPALVQYSILLHLLHMTELLETQGIYPLREYLIKLAEKTSKSAGILLHDPGIDKIQELAKKDEDHPKLGALLEKIKNLAGKRMIVFVQYRAQISRIEKYLIENGISAKQFVGKKDGITRKIQEQTIAEFREGKFDVLVASSIGEEGLDIPSVDCVIFYEPVPSEIRSIQRRGRAARLKEGEIIILITKGTRDESYFYASRNREKQMKNILHSMKEGQEKKSNEKKEKQKTHKEKQVEKNNGIKIKKQEQTKMSDFG